ncbi:hypothetical protein [Xenorhabdus bovienii]|uniref:Uncharacterized protein n=1 Tax=Xenorhabdus bovienii str. kraussei Quebec TaxID=1398203 RepID=A0A077PFV3_XENBV|nr:hypothetical protein [Xenorhabdus bovienii]CDH20038.1 hypothetical protein XBKQ1_2400014 [Xenorhabdus bovienii str. kraussei Quebec]MDE9432872.1 hypothetical protein [Xenorhabdus bovienii]MDE9442282.1 hypothetical protein [Xenorhabdus bovienii]MDE9490648.1 hypothetical protein [Xenorhabdus bovienii]MDE9506792.1 hypothetical protein [Xenorhabdus bovienii]
MEDKKWVFSQLVKNDSDYQGLLAYVCYKQEKDKLASDLRAKGCDEGEIEQRLIQFHDTSLTENQLKKFRRQGLEVMRAITTEIDAEFQKKEIELKENHKNEMDEKKKEYEKKLKKEKESAKKNEKSRIIRNIEEYIPKEKNWFFRSFLWILNGFQSIVAMILAIFILYGSAIMFSDDETKKITIGNFWGRIINIFNNPIPSQEYDFSNVKENLDYTSDTEK